MKKFCILNFYPAKNFFGFIFSTKEFLSDLNRVAKGHHFFAPDFTPQDLQQIPIIYRSVLEDPVIIRRNLFKGRGKFSRLKRFRARNLSENVKIGSKIRNLKKFSVFLQRFI